MSALDPAVFLFFATLFVGVVVLIILKGKSWKPVVAGMVVFMLIAVAFGGLAFAGVPGLWNIGETPPPTSQSVFTARVLSTSAVSVAGQTIVISTDGHTATWTMTDANIATLTSVELQVSVTNQNTGNQSKTWPFAAQMVSCSTITVNNAQASPCLQNPDSTARVTMSLLQTGPPTGSQSGNTFASNDWITGASDIFDAAMLTDTTVTTAMVQGNIFTISYSVGGVSVAAKLVDGG